MNNNSLEHFNEELIAKCVVKYGTPLYLYSENAMIGKCRQFKNMPSAFGVTPFYAMKANPNMNLLRLFLSQGFGIDASTFNEVRRALAAGIPHCKISLTSQEVVTNLEELAEWLFKGLQYNICSLTQIKTLIQMKNSSQYEYSIRLHPGIGSGESATRNTGNKYACFGIHQSNLKETIKLLEDNNLSITKAHIHIGSGADPGVWTQAIDVVLDLVDQFFPEATTVNLGGGFKEARMPNEIPVNIRELGEAAKSKFLEFSQKTNRKLKMEVEPGTFITANAGLLITKVIDIKKTGEDGFIFAILDGGMESNIRPALYNSKHPFYVYDNSGKLVFQEGVCQKREKQNLILVGSCCETGDSFCYEDGHITEISLCELEIGDYVVVGGCGAYCSSMSPFNYNSRTQIPEILIKNKDQVFLIRKRQEIAQIVENEILL